MPTDALVVLSTLPDAAQARQLAGQLVGERLAACVNILPGLTSVYRWQGAVQQGSEVLLLIKTTRAGYARLADRLRRLHPYEVPEIIALPIEQGHTDYLQWITDSLADA